MSFSGRLLSGTAPLRGRAGLEMIVPTLDYHLVAQFWTIDDPHLAVLLSSIVGGTQPTGPRMRARVLRCRCGRRQRACLVFPAGQGWMFSRSSRRLECFGSQPSARRVWVLDEGWSAAKIGPRGP